MTASVAILRDRPVELSDTDIAAFVGKRVRELRVHRGMSQQKIADILGISYQQQHKYEAGANRISVGRLFKLATTLDVPLAWFFEGIGDAPPTEMAGGRATLLHARTFASIADPRVRTILSDLTRALAGAK